MQILNEVFDKIYVISSYATQNRLNDLIPFLNKENIKFELIIAPKKKYFISENEDKLWLGKGAFSLISANESIFLKEKYTKSATFCVIEDDVFFDENYIEKLSIFFKEIPSNWNILNLGYHIMSRIVYDTSKTYHKLKPDDHIVGTHIVAYKHNIVTEIIDKMEENRHPIDLFLSKNIYNNFNNYVCTEKIFFASSYREYENDKNEFYKKYKTEINTLG